jgi:hypothetical protein
LIEGQTGIAGDPFDEIERFEVGEEVPEVGRGVEALVEWR